MLEDTNRTNEKESIYGEPNCVEPEGSRCRPERGGDLPQTWDQPAHLLQLEAQIWRAECLGTQTDQGAGGRAQQAQTDVCRSRDGERCPEAVDRKKALRPPEKREAVGWLNKSLGLPVSRACKAVGLSSSTWYRPEADRASRDAPIVNRLNEVISRHGRWGFRKCYHWMRQRGAPWNHKRVRRVYREMGLNLPRRAKRRLPSRVKQALEAPPQPNKMWSMDFMHDTLYHGKRFRTLNVLDEGVREALAIEIDTSLPAERVIRVLEQLKESRPLPEQIRVDNGPELVSAKLVAWCEKHQVYLHHIQPGKPTQNAYIERFNRSFRREVLDAHLFSSLSEVREITYKWLISYNEERPHQALGYLPPAVFRQQQTITSTTTPQLKSSTFGMSH